METQTPKPRYRIEYFTLDQVVDSFDLFIKVMWSYKGVSFNRETKMYQFITKI